jgi:hypothetical protein
MVTNDATAVDAVNAVNAVEGNINYQLNTPPLHSLSNDTRH